MKLPTKAKFIKAVADIYYRKCCWDERKCSNCSDFDKVRRQYQKPKTKKVKKKPVKQPSMPAHGFVCTCDECM